jgi:hypothetical protein
MRLGFHLNPRVQNTNKLKYRLVLVLSTRHMMLAQFHLFWKHLALYLELLSGNLAIIKV